MEYMITNIYINNQIFNIELRNENLEKIFLRNFKKEIEYEIGDFVEVIKQNNKQVIEKKIPRPIDFLKFFNQSKFEKEEIKSKIEKYIEKIENEEYRLIIETILNKNEDFYMFPAAKAIHHAYIGGLSEHTLNILELSEIMIEKYNLDKDLMYTAIILHDCSKVKELENYGLTYSVEGNLIGHLVLIVEEIAIVCEKYKIKNSIKIIALKHMLLSHHGKLDYGSPKEPMIKEAYILSQLDEIDAKMNVLETGLESIQENKISNPLMGFDKRRFLNLK